MTLTEQGHILQLLPPQTLSAAASSATFTMKSWDHASILCFGGAGSGLTVRLFEATGAGGTGATAIGFRYAAGAVVDSDVCAALAAAGSAGVAMGTSNTFVVIELDGAELSDGSPWVHIQTSDPGTSRLFAASCVLSSGRFQEDVTATVL